MRVIAVIPLKPASQCKQRLAGVLDAVRRRRLVEAMLERVLDAVRTAPGLAGVGILTSDPSLVPSGIERLPDPGNSLNEALTATAAVLTARRADAMLVLPGDLPFITADDVEALLALARPRRVVVAPDARGSGTNALLLAPPRALVPQFGPGSLSAHLAAATVAGVDCQVCVRARIGGDIDEPADLGALLNDARFDFLRCPVEARCG